MQLNTSLRSALTAATTALLGHATPAAAATWEVNSGVLVYQEQGGIKTVEPSVQINRFFADQKKLSVTATFDTLSGASPSGASGAAQTVTSPSGHPVDVGTGDGLVYAPFKDQRSALSLSWDSKLTEQIGYTAGAAYSTEYDFSATSANLQLNRGFFKNNLTLAVGAAFEADTISPVGGTPQSFTLNGGHSPKEGDKTRQQWEGLFSASAVLTPHTLAYFALGFSEASGYLTDPYKVITVVDQFSGQPIDGIVFDNQLNPNDKKANLYEKRPDTRSRQSVFGQLKQSYGLDVLDVSYRFTNDDWQIQSHTIEGRYRWQFSDTWYLEPNLRWYHQSAAYFYRHSLINFQDISGSQINIRYASADRRLAAFDAATVGMKLSWAPAPSQELSFQLSAYQQQGDSHPDDAIGAQKNINFFPDQLTWWGQLQYRRQW